MDGLSWFCQINGQQYGPYSTAQLRQYLGEGRLHAGSLIRQVNAHQWVTAGSIAGLMAPMPSVVIPASPPTISVTTPYSTSHPETESAEEEPEKRKGSSFGILIALLLAILAGGVGCVLLVNFGKQYANSKLATPLEEEDATPHQVHVAPERIQAALNGVEHWTDALNVTKLGAKSFRIQLVGAWSPKGGASERYLYLELRIMNPEKSGKKLPYVSWNRATTPNQMPTVVMVDSKGQLCPLASAHNDDAATRSGETLLLEPGEEVSDVLAFAYPSSGFDYVNIALTYDAIDQGRRYFGFKIPRSMIGEQQSEISSSGTRQIIKSSSGSRDKEPTLDDINRQAERDVKRMEDERRKNREQQ